MTCFRMVFKIRNLFNRHSYFELEQVFFYFKRKFLPFIFVIFKTLDTTHKG